ncbi:translation initiation factor IF-2 [Streptomyces phyllanthi]|uniref:Translation initiation factor IF-2 n=1 Tax=Streptomyces phyllanthi TaxID=1803180 RepID=A0A5N8WEQ8_9ACTN|nr:translation initiation factor IF-2 [Streptomyces phyllanthi]MPY45960.1 translation initiation factor IF-2 [Streptomyces phyllanthi]
MAGESTGTGGGGTSFENMSHEQMLAWLDQANAGTVQAAADRLATAAKEITKIAEELKIRPQWVEWKGEGADAFRTWTADLANATLRLGDFSEDSAKWLGQASDAIARAQAAIPRDTKSAQANLAAATSAHNDPDAASVAAKSASELEALAASREKVRQEAAAEMVKLGQAYQLSATQMNGLERPKFPPPPEAVLPEDARKVNDGTLLTRSGAASQADVSAGTGPASVVHADVAADDTGAPRASTHGRALPEQSVPRQDAPPTRMGIDSVDTLLPEKQTATGPVGGPPGSGRVDGTGTGAAPQTGWIPQVPGGRAGTPISGRQGQGHPTATGRMPQLPGQAVPSPNPARVPGNAGIVGGRPVTPPSATPTQGIPRGTVVGAEAATGRGPMGPTNSTTTPAGRVVGQRGQAPSRRPPFPNGGVVGGSPQQTGRVATGTGNSGVAGSSGTASGSTTRGGIVGGASSAARPGETRGTGTPRAPRPPSSTSTGTSFSTGTGGGSGQPRRSAEDEKTRRQGPRRTMPPVTG